MGILKKVGDLLSPNDPELVEKTLARLNEQDTWNDVFSTKLIELLDKTDQIKSEIRDRLRKADERLQKAKFATQAESELLEKAAKYDDASRRLELAEAAEERASSLAAQAQTQLERASVALDSARKLAADAQSRADDANREFNSAQETELRAATLARSTVRFSAVTVALSWIAMGWAAWFLIRAASLLWIDVFLSVVILVAGMLVLRGTSK